MKQYYFYKGKKRLGPFSADQLKALVANRTIGSETLLFTDSGEKKRARQWLEQFADRNLSDSNSVLVDVPDVSASFISDESSSSENSPPNNSLSSVQNGFEVSPYLNNGKQPTEEGAYAFCAHCGHMVKLTAIICPNCGFPPAEGLKFCRKCGSPYERGQMICLKCGTLLKEEPEPKQQKTGISDIDIGCLAIVIGLVFIVIIILSTCSECVIKIAEMFCSLFE